MSSSGSDSGVVSTFKVACNSPPKISFREIDHTVQNQDKMPDFLQSCWFSNTTPTQGDKLTSAYSDVPEPIAPFEGQRRLMFHVKHSRSTMFHVKHRRYVVVLALAACALA